MMYVDVMIPAREKGTALAWCLGVSLVSKLVAEQTFDDVPQSRIDKDGIPQWNGFDMKHLCQRK